MGRLYNGSVFLCPGWRGDRVSAYIEMKTGKFHGLTGDNTKKKTNKEAPPNVYSLRPSSPPSGVYARLRLYVSLVCLHIVFLSWHSSCPLQDSRSLRLSLSYRFPTCRLRLGPSFAPR